jgi:hypothetical protein
MVVATTDTITEVEVITGKERLILKEMGLSHLENVPIRNHL